MHQQCGFGALWLPEEMTPACVLCFPLTSTLKVSYASTVNRALFGKPWIAKSLCILQNGSCSPAWPPRAGECVDLQAPLNISSCSCSDFCYSSDFLHSAAQMIDFQIKPCVAQEQMGEWGPLPFINTQRHSTWNKWTSCFQYWGTWILLQPLYQEENHVLDVWLKPLLEKSSKTLKIVSFVQKLYNFNLWSSGIVSK